MEKVLITGGSRGIGASCVKKYTENGYAVAFIYKNSDAEAKALAEKTGALAIKADISVPSDVISAVETARVYMGGIDILVNNAGISQIKLFTGITDADWRKMIDTNLSGTFYVTREVARTMISQKHGKIVSIGSMWGKSGASCEVHYSASKAALRGMTTALAKELGASGITVNCIEPGVIDTEMNASLDEATLGELKNETPLGRIGKPSDVANAAFFLTSESADFITGQIIGVDGGFAV